MEPAQQRLLFGGKQLEDDHSMFFNYNLKVNDIIQLMVRQPLGELQSSNLPSTPSKEENITSRLKRKQEEGASPRGRCPFRNTKV